MLLTYFFIAAPGLLLGFSSFHYVLANLVPCRKSPRTVRILGNVTAMSLQIASFFGLFIASALSNLWTKELPDLATGYEHTLKTLAYLSAASNLEVKFLGVFCHGPEMRRLVTQATDAETRYEAALQLALVISIYMNSGEITKAGLLSGMSSILVIGKVGVQSFLERQEYRLTNTSMTGKSLLAISVLPVFVLTALFNIGAIAILNAWDTMLGSLVLIPLALGPPIVIILPFKIYLPLNHLTVASINQGVVAELVTQHLWPPIHQGARIGLAVTVYHLLLFSAFLAWVLSHPERSRVSEICTRFEAQEAVSEWAEETSIRYQRASILCLSFGWTTLPLIILQVVGKNKFTMLVTKRFKKNPVRSEVERSPS